MRRQSRNVASDEIHGAARISMKSISKFSRVRTIACLLAAFPQFIYSQVKGTTFLKHRGQGVNEIRLLRYVTAQVFARRVSRVSRAFGFIPCNFPQDYSSRASPLR